MSSRRMPLVIWISMVSVLLPMRTSATPYWGPAEVARWEAGAGTPPLPEVGPGSPDEHAVFPRDERQYAEMFSRIADFLDVWQVHTPGDPNFGGIREGEHLPGIIQTDNTSEAIWVWSRHFELTGDGQYEQNIHDAFTYSLRFPAYLEEGGDNPLYAYYRMYNCGWAVRAELKFRDVYGDETYKAYSDSCASYLRHHTLIRQGTGFYAYVNPPVLSWAMGNLYHAGIHEANLEWVNEAERQARERVKAWVEQEPTLLGNETWAMSGGATMWGLLASYFRDHPEETAGWLTAYKDYMDAWSSPGDYQNAWNGWYAWGHLATGRALDDPYHIERHLLITDFLVAEDADHDGGIPVRPQDSDAMDQTWVANYLAFMGCDPLTEQPADVFAPTDRGLAGGRVPADGGLWLSIAPNPGVTYSEIRCDLPQAGLISLAIHSLEGRLVRQIVSAPLRGGERCYHWDGRDASGRPVGPGAYLAVLTADRGRVARPIIWLR